MALNALLNAADNAQHWVMLKLAPQEPKTRKPSQPSKALVELPSRITERPGRAQKNGTLASAPIGEASGYSK